MKRKMRHDEVDLKDPAFQCALARAQGQVVEPPKSDGKGNYKRTRRQAATAVLDYTNYINRYGLDDVLARHELIKTEVVTPRRAPTHSSMAGASA